MRVGWGGVGGLIANNVQVYLHTRHATLLHVPLALPHTRHATLLHVPFALPHTRHATLLHVFLALAHIGHATLGWGGVGGLITFKYTSTHKSCYATARSSCTSTHTSYYATARSSCTCTHTHVMLRYCTFLLHFHTHVMLRDCTFLLHFHTHVMLGYCTFLLHFHTHVMLRYCTFLLHLHTHTSCYATARSSSPCTRHKKSEWTKKCKVKGKAKLAGTQVLDRSWMWLKKFVPHALKNRNDKVINLRLWEYIYQFVYRHNQKD